MLRRCVSPRLIRGDPAPLSAETTLTVPQGRSRRSGDLQELRQRDAADGLLVHEGICATYEKTTAVVRRFITTFRGGALVLDLCT
jgi:hypothetical protein